jgi:undecaprenyl-diphosphatase
MSILNFQILISQISGTGVMFGIIVFICILVYIKNYKKDSLKIIFASTFAMFVTFTLKYLLNVPRPAHMLIVETDPRFPSGHATMASVVMALVIYYSNKHIKNSYLRYFLYICAVSWFLLVSYSRLYLRVHYPIDIIAGGLIGVVSTVIVMKIFKHLHYYNS